MRHLFLAGLACLLSVMPLGAQVGLHLDNNGIGLHYRAHPEKTIAFDGSLSFGFTSNTKGLYYSQYSTSLGIRWNFLQSEHFTVYTGFRGNIQIAFMHGDEHPVNWYTSYAQRIGDRTAMNLGYTIPIGFSWKMGDEKQWEWFLDTGVTRQLNRDPSFAGHLRVGATYFFGR